MLPTTILVDELPKCVVRPVDMKDLQRFLGNGKTYLLRERSGARITHRMADNAEAAKWQEAFALHLAWGGDENGFFGVPL
jgi:hypothetical protein